jgi:hypothetical protein
MAYIVLGQALGFEIDGFSVRQATERDLEACNRLCRKAHGHERNHELFDAIKQKTASVVDHDGRISGSRDRHSLTLPSERIRAIGSSGSVDDYRPTAADSRPEGSVGTAPTLPMGYCGA